MKSRIVHYLIFLLLLAPFLLVDNFGEKIYFLRWIAIPAIVLMLGFLIYKTRKSKWVKKVVVAFAMSLSLGAVINVSLPTTVYAKSPQERLAELEAKKKEIMAKIEKAHAEGKSTSGGLFSDGLDGDLEDVIEDINKIRQEMMAACPSGKQLLEETCNGCWPCDLMAMIIDAVDKLAVAFFEILKEGQYPLKMLGWGFAFWILFHVLKMLMTFSDSKFFAMFFKQAVACAVATAFLALPISSMLDWFVTPIFQFGEGMSEALTTAAGDADPGGNGIDKALYRRLGVDRSKCKYQVEQRYAVSAFSPELKETILNMTSNLYQTIAPPVVIGQTLVCYSRSKGATEVPLIGVVIPDFGMLIIGATIVASFTMMMVFVPFYFADALIKVGFVITLFPFYVVAAAFDKTRHIVKNALNTILSAIAVFIVACMMMVFIVQLFYEAIVSDPSQIANYLAGGEKGVPGLYELLGGNGSGGMTFLVILGTTYLSFKMIKMIDSLASALMGDGYQSVAGDTPQWAAGQAMGAMKFAGAAALATHAGVAKLASKAGNRMMNAGKIRHEKATNAKMRAAGHRNYSEALSNKAQGNAASAAKHAQLAASSTGLKKLVHQAGAGLATIAGVTNNFRADRQAKKAAKVLDKNKKVIAKDNAKKAEIQGHLASGKEDLRNKAVGHEKKSASYERLAEKNKKALGNLKWYDPRNLSPARLLAKSKINRLNKKAEKEARKGASLRLDEKNLEYKLMTETPRGLRIAGGALKALGDSGLAANKLIGKLTGIEKEMEEWNKKNYWLTYKNQRDKWEAERKAEKDRKKRIERRRLVHMAKIEVEQKEKWAENRKNLMEQAAQNRKNVSKMRTLNRMDDHNKDRDIARLQQSLAEEQKRKERLDLKVMATRDNSELYGKKGDERTKTMDYHRTMKEREELLKQIKTTQKEIRDTESGKAQRERLQSINRIKKDDDRISNNLINRDAKNAIKVDHRPIGRKIDRMERKIKRGLDGLFGGKKKA